MNARLECIFKGQCLIWCFLICMRPLPLHTTGLPCLPLIIAFALPQAYRSDASVAQGTSSWIEVLEIVYFTDLCTERYANGQAHNFTLRLSICHLFSQKVEHAVNKANDEMCASQSYCHSRLAAGMQPR